MEFKKELTRGFQYLYKEKYDSESPEEQKFITEEQAFQEEFGWYSMLYQAAGEKYLEITKVLDSPANEFLMFMNFYCQKTNLDTKRINSQNKN